MASHSGRRTDSHVEQGSPLAACCGIQCANRFFAKSTMIFLDLATFIDFLVGLTTHIVIHSQAYHRYVNIRHPE